MRGYVVLNKNFDPELHSVWGPFRTRLEAEEWKNEQPDKEELIVEALVKSL